MLLIQKDYKKTIKSIALNTAVVLGTLGGVTALGVGGVVVAHDLQQEEIKEDALIKQRSQTIIPALRFADDQKFAWSNPRKHAWAPENEDLERQVQADPILLLTTNYGKAAAGDVESIGIIGTVLATRFESAEDHNLGLQCLKIASDNGNAIASWELYKQLKDVDLDTAEIYAVIAARAGHREAKGVEMELCERLDTDGCLSFKKSSLDIFSSLSRLELPVIPSKIGSQEGK